MSWRQRADRLRAIPLPAVLRLCGAQPDPYDRYKWHTHRGVITVTGVKFMNWNCGCGGGGAIDLAMHLHPMGFGQALQWLEQHFGADLILPATSPPRSTLSIPPSCPHQLEQVRRYLIHERRLPPALLEPLFRSGDLYADVRANAVFLLRTKDGQPVGAELRGTTFYPWRGMAPGSRKDHGFFAVPNASLEDILLCESAIDAISAHALHPEYRCLSTAGARPDPAWLPELITQSRRIYCGFDIDVTGESMASTMIARHPCVQRLRPPSKDWNAALQSKPSAL